MTQILLLNASFEPLSVIGLERAVALWLEGKAELLEAAPGRVLRSPSRAWPMPSVLRLRRYVNVPRRGAAWSRKDVLARDGYTCAYCGRPMTGREATVDHVIPQWKCRQMNVPASTWSNTVACCRACQQRKGGRSMHEAGMRFHSPTFEPKTPRVNYLVLSLSPLPEWRKYILR
ncbi:MAG: HNH endonuclease [Chloroflexi bacterium]|nr:HNH endonuclease [Chloroflexota bacterium]